MFASFVNKTIMQLLASVKLVQPAILGKLDASDAVAVDVKNVLLVIFLTRVDAKSVT